MGDYTGRKAIATRAHAGLLRSKAQRFLQGDQSADDTELPPGFWWAEGEAALDQNWVLGDFDTWIEGKERWQAFGVTFLRSQAAHLAPTLAPPPERWLSSREATDLVARATGHEPIPALYSIITYAKTGHVRGRALNRTEETSYRYGNKTLDYPDEEIPAWFWKQCTAYGSSALDWRSGIYAGKGYVDGNNIEVRLTGVEFEAESLAVLAPKAAAAPLVETPPKAESKAAGGRPMAATWPAWVAELAAYIHDHGLPDGEGVQGLEQLITAIADRLAERDVEGPSRSTVQEAAKAVLLRLRQGAGNQN